MKEQVKSVAKVAGYHGDVELLSRGVLIKVVPGTPVLPGDTLLTGANAAVIIELPNGEFYSLGQEQSQQITAGFLDSLHTAVPPDLNLSEQAIEQAILEGSIDQLLPDTAAGELSSGSSLQAADFSVLQIDSSLETNISVVSSLQSEDSPLFSGNLIIQSSGPTSESATGNDLVVFISKDNEGALTDPEGPGSEEPVVPSSPNNAPTVSAIANVNVSQGDVIQLDLSSYFTDQDSGQTLTFSSNELPEGITLEAGTGTLSGVATNSMAMNPEGAYQISVTATDDSGADNNSASGSFQLTVTNVNDAPTASDSRLESIEEDRSALIEESYLLSLAADIDGDDLTLVGAALESGSGELIEEGGDFIFVPESNWFGDAQFSYTVADASGEEATGRISLDVTPVNDVPDAIADGVVRTLEDTPITIDLLANDIDLDGDVLSFSMLDVNNGSVVVNADNTVTYTPGENLSGRDMLTYTISDGNGGEDTAFALINISAVNDAPEVESAFMDMTLAAGLETLTISLGDYFQDVETPDSQLNFEATGHNHILVDIDDGFATLSVLDGWTGMETLTFTASDPEGKAVSAQLSVDVLESGGEAVVAATTESDVAVVSDEGLNFTEVLGDQGVINIGAGEALAQSSAGESLTMLSADLSSLYGSSDSHIMSQILGSGNLTTEV